jgi:hypothetical protein
MTKNPRHSAGVSLFMPKRPQNKRKGAEVIRDEFWEEAPTAAKHIRDFARTGSLKIKPMKLSPTELEAGYQVLTCDDPKVIIKSCEQILDSIMPGKGEGGEFDDLPKMSFVQFAKAITHDGITPCIHTTAELMDYLQSGADIAELDPDLVAEIGNAETQAAIHALATGASPGASPDVSSCVVDSDRGT